MAWGTWKANRCVNLVDPKIFWKVFKLIGALPREFCCVQVNSVLKSLLSNFSLSSVIVRVSVVLKRTVGSSDWRFDNLSGSHLQSHCDIVPSEDGTISQWLWRWQTTDTPGFKPFTMLVPLPVHRMLMRHYEEDITWNLAARANHNNTVCELEKIVSIRFYPRHLCQQTTVNSFIAVI